MNIFSRYVTGDTVCHSSYKGQQWTLYRIAETNVTYREKSLITCTFRHLFLGRWNREGWDGRVV